MDPDEDFDIGDFDPSKITVKTEPREDEQPLERPKRQKISTDEYCARKFPEARNGQVVNPAAFEQPSTSRAGGIRDPRLNKPNDNRLLLDQARQAFLNRELNAGELINATVTDPGYHQSPILKNAHQQAQEGYDRLTKRKFQSNIPPDPRYGHIPQELQATGHLLAIDLARISAPDKVTSSRKRQDPTEARFDSHRMLRSIGCQVEGLGKQKVDQETQTTVNTEGFNYFIPNVRALTQDQRDALSVFKEAMGIVDDPSTSAVQERIQHRRVRQSFDQARLNGNRDLDCISPQAFANPPAPLISAGPPRSKYANAVPR